MHVFSLLASHQSHVYKILAIKKCARNNFEYDTCFNQRIARCLYYMIVDVLTKCTMLHYTNIALNLTIMFFIYIPFMITSRV